MSRRTNGSSSTTKMDLPANVQRLSTLASGPNIVPALRRGGDLARNIASNLVVTKASSTAVHPVSLLQRGNPMVGALARRLSALALVGLAARLICSAQENLCEARGSAHANALKGD